MCDKHLMNVLILLLSKIKVIGMLEDELVEATLTAISLFIWPPTGKLSPWELFVEFLDGVYDLQGRIVDEVVDFIMDVVGYLIPDDGINIDDTNISKSQTKCWIKGFVKLGIKQILKKFTFESLKQWFQEKLIKTVVYFILFGCSRGVFFSCAGTAIGIPMFNRF